MKVFVIGLNGTRLMPCSERKARLLIKNKKAEIVNRKPFTIHLLYKTGSTTQPVTVGVDTGSQHIGIAVCSKEKVLYKAEIELRSSMEKRALLETRKSYRRGRRYRKVRYRKPKFQAKTKRIYSEAIIKRKSTGKMTHWIKVSNEYTTSREDGWLPPSIQSKLNHHKRWIDRYLDVLPENTKLTVETARFDVARIKDPSVHGELYQQGSLYDFENVNAYVFSRDNYKCKVCGAKAGTRRKDGTAVKLIAHHIDFRSKGATDNPDRIISVCDACHTAQAHKEGGILYQWMKENKKMARGYRDMTLMNIVKRRMYQYYPHAKFTYGNITSADRKKLQLGKTHANDAVAIAMHGSENVTDINHTLYYMQVRKKKRSLHEATPRKGRKEKNTQAKRNSKNTPCITVKTKTGVRLIYLYDEVYFHGTRCWVTGFTGKTGVYLKDAYGNYVTETEKYKQVALAHVNPIKHNNNWVSYVG